MRNANTGRPFQPLEPLIPVGKVIEHDTEAGWLMFMSEWSKLYDNPQDIRAQELAEQ